MAGRPKIKEGTLRRVAMDAKNNYSEYKRHAKLDLEYERKLGTTATRAVAEDPSVESPKTITYSEKFVQEGAQHFHNHEAGYHDLAVIEAHLDGVTISVEQPLEIGQKIEVHKA